MPAQRMPALSMSQTKEDLVKYLGLRPETYMLMAKETDIAYKWLTTSTQHLKSNCTRAPPYDWSDITEASKERAMIRLAQSGDSHTSQFWTLGVERTADGCPNWIARWFLYHKFRYRDGRNRGKDSKTSPKYGSSGSSNSKSRGKTQSKNDSQTHYSPVQVTGSPTRSAYGSYSQELTAYQSPSSSSSSSYYMQDPYTYSNNSSSSSSSSSMPTQRSSFYDPVKGYWIPKD